jgi:hypothetical protein
LGLGESLELLATSEADGVEIFRYFLVLARMVTVGDNSCHHLSSGIVWMPLALIAILLNFVFGIELGTTDFASLVEHFGHSSFVVFMFSCAFIIPH